MGHLKIARAGSHTNVMVVTDRGQIPLWRKIPVPTITMSGSVALVAVVAADIDPLQSIGRPRSAPAAVVGGIGEGYANEREAMEAVMEERVVTEVAPVSERES
jgi:hypothetical protein